MPETLKPDDPALRKVIDKRLVAETDRVYVIDGDGAHQFRRDASGPVVREPIGPLRSGRR